MQFTTDIVSLLVSNFLWNTVSIRKIKYDKFTSRSRVAISTCKQTATLNFMGLLIVFKYFQRKVRWRWRHRLFTFAFVQSFNFNAALYINYSKCKH